MWVESQQLCQSQPCEAMGGFNGCWPVLVMLGLSKWVGVKAGWSGVFGCH